MQLAALQLYVLRRNIGELERQVKKQMPVGANYTAWHAYQSFQQQRLEVLRAELENSAESAQVE